MSMWKQWLLGGWYPQGLIVHQQLYIYSQDITLLARSHFILILRHNFYSLKILQSLRDEEQQLKYCYLILKFHLSLRYSCILVHYEKKVWIVMANNSTTINKMNNHLLPQLTEHKTDLRHWKSRCRHKNDLSHWKSRCRHKTDLRHWKSRCRHKNDLRHWKSRCRHKTDLRHWKSWCRHKNDLRHWKSWCRHKNDLRHWKSWCRHKTDLRHWKSWCRHNNVAGLNQSVESQPFSSC
jgi:hypothetical protein